MKVALIAAMTVLATPLAAAAQSGSALVEELVVNARTPGPAWWSVSKGDAKVWVLGLTAGAGFREDDRWDTKVFERRLGKGGRLIHADTAPVARMTDDEMTTSRRWVSKLKPDDLERYVRALRITGTDPASIAWATPNAAAIRLAYVSYPPKLSPKVRLLMRAKVLDAKADPVGGSLAWPFRVSLKEASMDEFSCLNAVTRMVTEPERVRASAEAWMRGDVRSLVQVKMTYDPCTLSMPKMNEAKLRQDAALADAIAETLDAGKSAVALVDLVPLLLTGGVLDRLRARGYVIRTPAQLDED